MKFKIQPDTLSKSLTLSAIVADFKGVIPESACVLLTAREDRLQQMCVSGVAAIRHWVPAEIQNDGEVAVDLQMLMADASSLRSEVTANSTATNLILRAGKSERKRRLVPLDLFPEYPKIDSKKCEVSSFSLAEALRNVEFAALRDASRPELRCVRIANGIVLGGDGLRVAKTSLDVDLELTIPIERIAPILTILSLSDKVEVSAGNWVSIETDTCEFAFSTLSTKYPDRVAEVIGDLEKKEPIAEFHIDKSIVLNILSSLKVYTERARRYGIEYVVLDTEGDYPRLIADIPDVGRFEDELPITKSTGKTGNIKFSPNYMYEGFSKVSGDTAIMRVFSPMHPVLILDPDNEQWSLVQAVVADRKTVQEAADDF